MNCIHRILIADDHAIVREGLKLILGELPRPVDIGEAETGQQALTRVREESWDLVVLDISLPDRNGLDVLKQIKTSRPGLPVLILSMHGEAEYAVRAIRAGASGYLTKRSARTELLDAVNRIEEGRRYVTPTVAEHLLMETGRGETERSLETLSDREFQVLCLLAAGRRTKDIAEQLGLSAKTVSTHRSNILDKLGLETTAELIRYAISRGLA